MLLQAKRVTGHYYTFKKIKAMKEIANTSNTALKDQSKDTLNKIIFLLKGLQHCKPISGNLLFRIVEKIDVNSNTVLI